MSNGFKRGDYSVFATIADASQDSKALARRNRDISDPANLVGKRVATTVGTTAHFFLFTFLSLNGSDPPDIELINLRPGEMVDAIATATDDLDVIGALEPNILKFQKSLWENGLILPILTGYESTFSLVSFNGFIVPNLAINTGRRGKVVDTERFDGRTGHTQCF